MTNEKRELLEWLDNMFELPVSETGYPCKHHRTMIDKLRALIEAPPPKHTQCENCLDDLEDYVWVYCDKCWQALCTEANQLIVKNRELKKSRQTVDELLKYWGTVDVHRKICDTDLGWYIGKLQEAGVEIKEEK